jgi:hypothetical protein
LALLTLALAGGLLTVALAALRLPLVLLTVSALRSLIALRRLARGLVALATLHRLILRLTLAFLSTLAGAVLSCGAALRARALRRRALRTARLASAPRHVLRRCQGYSSQQRRGAD